MQTVELELLRRGPAHNQLLSPLTEYLTLCGSHPMSVTRIPYEHREFIARLRALRYEVASIDDRHERLREVEDLMTGILAQVAGLLAESQASKEPWLHLRLLLAPKELAMLPFEMARTPDGMPGQGLPLLLNPKRPMTLTRGVRLPSRRDFCWPEQVRVLFAAAGDVPREAHALALRNALDPWIRPRPGGSSLTPDVGSLLTVLPDASLADIQTACRRESFTHVHILAHGALDKRGGDRRFGLALRPGRGSATDGVVDGLSLANALRCLDDRGSFSQPAVVTVASCDGGNETEINEPGAGLAHALHEASVPFVLASQFPLSKRGSVLAVREFYDQVFRGEDPRSALYAVRQALFAARFDAHDWASLVAYDRLPDDLPKQLEQVRPKRIFARMKAANAWAADVAEANTSQRREHLACAVASIRDSIAILRREDLLPHAAEIRAEILGLIGSGEKRLANLLWAQHNQPRLQTDPAGPPGALREAELALRRARDAYRLASDALAAHHWSQVQYLSLTAILDGCLASERRYCEVAYFGAERDLCSPDAQARAWAHSSLAELELLWPLVEAPPWDWDSHLDKAKGHLDGAVRDRGQDMTEHAQLKRYCDWYPKQFPTSWNLELARHAAELLDHLRCSSDSHGAPRDAASPPDD